MPLAYNWQLVSSAATTTAWTQWHPSGVLWQASGTATTFTTINNWATNAWTIQNSLAQWGSGLIQGAPAIVSEETRRRMREEQARYDAEMARATAERRATEEAARGRARALLLSTLTRDQQRSLEERKFFDMNVNGRTYRIRLGTHGNVRLIEGGREVRSFCAQPDGVPIEDAMLAQKLMLEADEQAFLRVANARELWAA